MDTAESPFDVEEFVRRVLAEDLGEGGDVTSNATIDADARFHAEYQLPRSNRCCRAGNRRGVLPRAGSGGSDRDAGQRRRPRVRRHGADAARRQCPGDARRGAIGAQHAAASVGHRHADAPICRRDRRDRRDAARYAQDDPGPAGARQICGADGRRAKPPHAARRRRADQGQSCRGCGGVAAGGARGQGGE